MTTASCPSSSLPRPQKTQSMWGKQMLSTGSPLLRLRQTPQALHLEVSENETETATFYWARGKVEKGEKRKGVKTQAQRSKQKRFYRTRKREHAGAQNKRKKFGQWLSSPQILLRSPALPILRFSEICQSPVNKFLSRNQGFLHQLLSPSEALGAESLDRAKRTSSLIPAPPLHPQFSR